MDELGERKEKILNAIIQNYLETGEPVGSRTISKMSDLNLSSATIRNEMSDLEELGYIVQPHTSSGRIPSDKGYRFYVDHLMEVKDREVTEMKDLMIEKTEKMEFQVQTVQTERRIICTLPTRTVLMAGQVFLYLTELTNCILVSILIPLKRILPIQQNTRGARLRESREWLGGLISCNPTQNYS